MTTRRVVAIDDQVEMLDIIRLAVSMAPDWELVPCTAIEPALSDAGPVDAVLLDLSVTDADPTGAVARIASTLSAPIVLLTSTALTAGEVRRIGAAGVIAKPFDVTTLPDDIADLLGWD